MKTCTKCNRELPATEEFFYLNSRYADGFRGWCKDCDRAYAAAYANKHYHSDPVYQERVKAESRKWRAENPEKRRAQDKLKREEKHTFICEYLLEHPCVDCGERDIICLDFDHVAGRKKAEIFSLLYHSLETIKSEIAKCVVRCSNCHRKRHAHEKGFFRSKYTKAAILTVKMFS
jgi:hypothetical protein